MIRIIRAAPSIAALTGLVLALISVPAAPASALGGAAPSPAPDAGFWEALRAASSGDRVAALAEMRTACAGGMAYGCFMVGEMLLEETASAANAEAAREAYLQACRIGGAPEGCTEYGRLLWRGVGGGADPQGARAAFADGCAAGDSLGCFHQGVLLEAGIGGPADAAAARARLHTSCDHGHIASCARLGVMLAQGAGGEPDASNARTVLSRACQSRGSPDACGNLGAMLAAGLGGPVEPARARSHLVGACSHGFAPACSNLDTLAAARPPRGAAPALIPVLLPERDEAGCAAGEAAACHVTALMLQGAPGSRNEEAARRALACVMGSQRDCRGEEER